MPPTHRVPRFLGCLALAAMLMAPVTALAGELVLAADPVATDGDGKITAAGRKQAVSKIDSVPGDEIWHLSLWAKLDKGAPGPLYVEFWGKLNGKPYLTYRHEKADYAGDPFVSLTFDLEGGVGFNKGKTYTVKVVQVASKRRDIVLATGKLTLEYVEPKAGADDFGGEDEGGEEDGEDEGDSAAQDELDTLVGGEEGVAPGDSNGSPPPVTPPGKKKGCHIDPGAYGIPGLFVLFALGAGLSRRRA